jgi:hypothetical protein
VFLLCGGPSPCAHQPVSVQANDSCALVVGDVNINTTLEVDGTNFGYNMSYFSMRLQDISNVYVRGERLFPPYSGQTPCRRQDLNLPCLFCWLFRLCRTTVCTPCFLTQTKARCVTSASKVPAYNLTVAVSGQRSNPLSYLYSDVVSNTPPNIVSVVVTTAPSSSSLATVGNDTLVLTGTAQRAAPLHDSLVCSGVTSSLRSPLMPQVPSSEPTAPK